MIFSICSIVGDFLYIKTTKLYHFVVPQPWEPFGTLLHASIALGATIFIQFDGLGREL